MRRFFTFLVIFGLMSCNKKEQIQDFFSTDKEQITPKIDTKKTTDKATEALQFCKKKNYNTDFCILIDMSLHSGVKRMVIWDFNQKKITHQFLVGHGCGNRIWSLDLSKDNPKFSNEDGSHLSSLGKYKVGERGYSDWGIHVKYLLHGLEDTNDNALKRFIVLHSWEKMSDEEVFPDGSPEGWGCPTVSNNSMKIIDEILKKSNKPILFWIYK